MSVLETFAPCAGRAPPPRSPPCQPTAAPPPRCVLPRAAAGTAMDGDRLLLLLTMRPAAGAARSAQAAAGAACAARAAACSVSLCARTPPPLLRACAPTSAVSSPPTSPAGPLCRRAASRGCLQPRLWSHVALLLSAQLWSLQCWPMLSPTRRCDRSAAQHATPTCCTNHSSAQLPLPASQQRAERLTQPQQHPGDTLPLPTGVPPPCR